MQNMNMNINTQKGYVANGILLLVAVVAIGGVACYAFCAKNDTPAPVIFGGKDDKNPSQPIAEQPIAMHGLIVDITPEDDELVVSVEGDVVQRLKLSKDGEETYNFLEGRISRFVLNDFNFDGSVDAALLVSTGYAGVNNYYDIFLFDPVTQRFQVAAALKEISEPSVNATTGEFKSSYRSGPVWYDDVYKFEGGVFVKIVSGRQVTVEE